MARFGFGGSPGRGMGQRGQRGQRGNGRALCDGTRSGLRSEAGLQNGFGMGRGFRGGRFEEGDGRLGSGGNRAFAPDQDRGAIARIESAIEELRRQIAALKTKA